MSSQHFLSEFPPVTTEAWEQAILNAVKRDEYASKLTWRPEEGLAVRPYYRAEDLAGLRYLEARPGDFPYVRGSRCTGEWRIREEIVEIDPEDANRAALNALQSGAEEIAFHRVRIENSSDAAILVANLGEITLHFPGLGASTLGILINRLAKRPHGTAVSADIDPLLDLDTSALTLRSLPPAICPFAICANRFEEMGAGAIEQVAYALAAGVDYLAAMQDRGATLDCAVNALSFSFAIGPQFFIQIAKLRAFRLLWAQIVESFSGAPDQARCRIHARTAHWNETLYDPHLNILRSTTEAVSAILGGADTLSVGPYDECFRPPDENSRRLARNTQLILKHEAYLAQVADAAGGSYLIEWLTDSIAAQAWNVLQEIEQAGGYLRAKAAGLIESRLIQRIQARSDAVACRRRVLVGTNRFADPSERASSRSDSAALPADRRVSEPFEQLRLRTEDYIRTTGKTPAILLAQFGDSKMSAARAQFASEFLACSGLSSAAQCFEHATQIPVDQFDVVVLCSSDDEYLPFTRELMSVLQEHCSHPLVLIAGSPASAQELQHLGISDFIHLRSNLIDVLSTLQRHIGIEGSHAA